MSKRSASSRRVHALCIASVVAIIAVALLALATPYRTPVKKAMAPHASTQVTSITQPQREQLQATFAALPLAFEQNAGQIDPQVKFTARANGYTLFLTNRDAVFSFRTKSSRGDAAQRSTSFHGMSGSVTNKDSVHVVRMQVINGNPAAAPQAWDALPGKSNYFLGKDPKNWHTGVPQFARVSYKNVYPGVDLAYYGQQSKLEFDFVVAPDADAAPIGLAFKGAEAIATDGSGNLVVSSAAGNVVLHTPFAYQQSNGNRQLVDARFELRGKNKVGISLGSYDRKRELVIDPSVTYSTYLGGTAEDDGYGIGFDSTGAAYVTGQTESTDFPTAGGISPNTNKGAFDAFVTKFAANGSSLIYSTYVGGTGSDSGNALAVDSSGDVFVAGGTTSSDFPTTASAFQKTYGGGSVDGFAFELNPAGTALTYSTYLGGSGEDVATGIAIDSSGAYVVGKTGSTNFPPNPTIQTQLAGTGNGFVAKLNPAGSALLYATYLGGGTGDFASAVAVAAGAAYVTGGTENPTFPTTTGVIQPKCGSDGTCNGGLYDAFVSVINPAGSAFIYSTFLGGSGLDEGLGIAVDSSGNAFVTGLTQSSDFPTQTPSQKTLGGTQDAFISQVNPTGTALVYSTYLGGSQSDAATSIALDQRDDAYVTGQTESSDFPVANPTQMASGGGNDAFVSELNSVGSLIFSTYLGGSLNENTNANGTGLAATGSIAVDSPGANVYVTGNTLSTNFPTKAPFQAAVAGLIDAFVVKYAFPTTPDFSLSATSPAAVKPGSSGTSTITLTAINGYSSPVKLSCSVAGSGSPLPACKATSFSPNPVTPTAAGVTSTLTVTTTGASAAILHPNRFFYALWIPVAGMSLLGISFSSARSRRKKIFGFLMVAMVMAALFMLPACGSSSGGGGGGGCTGCTPAGAYTVTVTATGTDAATTTHSTTLTLTVN